MDIIVSYLKLTIILMLCLYIHSLTPLAGQSHSTSQPASQPADPYLRRCFHSQLYYAPEGTNSVEFETIWLSQKAIVFKWTDWILCVCIMVCKHIINANGIWTLESTKY